MKEVKITIASQAVQALEDSINSMHNKGVQDLRIKLKVQKALSRVPGGEALAAYYLEGGQSREDAAATELGIEQLLDPETAEAAAERLHEIAKRCPFNPDYLRDLMRYDLAA